MFKEWTLIVGAGEVGRALFEVLGDHYRCTMMDLKGDGGGARPLDIMHICFPYSKHFSRDVKRYMKLYKPPLTVVHSTVPIGTCLDLGVIHSPIRGQHPNLQEGIRTFPKMIGGRDASKVADYFRRAGLTVELYDDSDTTEAAKLFDTEYYRMCIKYAKWVKEQCRKRGLSYHEVYTLPNLGYNEGYSRLGHPEYIRPVLQAIDGDIGGHCLIPNSKLI